MNIFWLLDIDETNLSNVDNETLDDLIHALNVPEDHEIDVNNVDILLGTITSDKN